MSKEDVDAAAMYVGLHFEEFAQARVEKALAAQRDALITEIVDSVVPSVVRSTVDKMQSHRKAEREKADQQIEAVAGKLPKRSKGPAIFRYLASNPAGVTFPEFCEYRIPGTGHRLTESIDPDSVAAMLRGWSTKFQKLGWKIETNRRGNQIKLVKATFKKLK